MKHLQEVSTHLVACVVYASASAILAGVRFYYQMDVLAAILVFVTCVPLVCAMTVMIEALLTCRKFTLEEILIGFVIDAILFFLPTALFLGYPGPIWNLPITSIAVLAAFTIPGATATMFGRIIVTE